LSLVDKRAVCTCDSSVEMMICYCVLAAGVPLKPDKTWISEGADGVLTVRWKTPYDGGSPVLQYLLLARYVPSCRLSYAGHVLVTAECKYTLL